jgi:predicted Na+-dependent transporter
MVTSTAFPHALGYVAVAVLAIHMLAAGLGIRISALADEGKPESVAVVVRSFIVLAFAMPLSAIAVIALCRLGGQTAAALLLAAISVGPPTLAGARAADRPLAATLLLFMSAPAAVMIPCWVWALGRGFGPALDVAPARAMGLVLVAVTVPLALGLAVRQLGDHLAARWAPRLDLVAMGGLTALVALSLIWAAPALPRGGAGIASAIAVVLVLLAAAGLARWAAGGDPTSDATVGEAAIVGNPAQALALVAVLFPDPAAIAFVSVFLIARLLAHRLYQKVGRSRWEQRHRAPLRQRLA